MNQTYPVFKREFLSYFRSPVAYVVIVVFLVASVGLSFFAAGFFKAGVATLEGFFTFFPWLFLLLIPASGMRLWSEEKRAGTWELLFTLPISTSAAVIGKFLAAWVFISFAIVLTFPMALTVGYLGDPDWGVIVASYIGSILMAGSYLGICSLTSALTKNQVISFILSVMICAVMLIGFHLFGELLNSWLNLPAWLADGISNFSFFPHFSAIYEGLINFNSLCFFASVMICTIWMNIVVLER